MKGNLNKEPDILIVLSELTVADLLNFSTSDWNVETEERSTAFA